MDSTRHYLKAIRPPQDTDLLALEAYAHAEGVPILCYEAKALIQVLLSIHQPKAILEIGTAIGFSALNMIRTLGSDCHITTIERDDKMIAAARTNFKDFGVTDQVTLLEGDALEVLKTLEGAYDFIFMDAAKGQYITFLPYCLDLLKCGGLLVSDNVLQGGLVAQSKWTIPRRQRTIHQRMRAYLHAITHDTSLNTVILPMADGVTISHKIQ